MAEANIIPTYAEFEATLPEDKKNMLYDLFVLTHDKREAECCGYIPRWYQYPIPRHHAFVCGSCNHSESLEGYLLGKSTHAYNYQILYFGCMLTIFPDIGGWRVSSVTKRLLQKSPQKTHYKNWSRIRESVRQRPEAWLKICAYLEQHRKKEPSNE